MDADERTQPESRIQVGYLRPFVLGLQSWETAIWDEGSGCFRYPARMAGIAGDAGLFQGEYVRTLYGKSTSRHLLRAL